MFSKKPMMGKELVRRALTSTSVVLINYQSNLRALYQKNKEGYLCIIQRLDDETKQNPVQISKQDYHIVLKKALSEKWKFILFNDKEVITENIDLAEIEKQFSE